MPSDDLILQINKKGLLMLSHGKAMRLDSEKYEPSELMNWLDKGSSPARADLVMEFLDGASMLNAKGKKFYYEFWKEYIAKKGVKKLAKGKKKK